MASWTPQEELQLWRAVQKDKASRSKMAFGEYPHMERGEVLITMKSYTKWALQQPGSAIGAKHQDFINFAASYVEVGSGDLLIKPWKVVEEKADEETPESAKSLAAAAQAITACRILLDLPELALEEAASAVTIAMAPDSSSVCEVLALVRRISHAEVVRT